MTFLDTALQDLRFGARALRRNPAFAAIAILTLALGIGANAAIFSVVNAVLLRPLPWSEPDRAVMIWSKWTAFDKTWVATGEVVDYRRRAQTLSEVAAWGEGQVNLTGDGDPERVAAASVTANLFPTLGVARNARTDVHRRARTCPTVRTSSCSATRCGRAATPPTPESSAAPSRSTARPTRSSASCRRASSCRPIIRIPSRRSCGCRCRWIPPAWTTAATASMPSAA